MLELALEFLFGVTSVAGGKRNKLTPRPNFTAFLIVWCVAVLSITLIFG